jgi:hypothetical protein
MAVRRSIWLARQTLALNLFCRGSRAALRIIWLLIEMARGAALTCPGRYTECANVKVDALPPRPVSRFERAWWLHRVCRRALRIFSVELAVRGDIPARGRSLPIT